MPAVTTSSRMKIALDAVGGDHGPTPCVEGAIQAVRESDVDVILVGDETTLKQECARLGCTDARLSIRHASQVVAMHESPAAMVANEITPRSVSGFESLSMVAPYTLAGSSVKLTRLASVSEVFEMVT